MFDITKYIQLDTHKQQKIYFILRISIFAGFLLLFLILSKEMIFPTYKFNFNAAIDSLANTISRPYETENGTSFHLSSSTQLDAIKVTLTLPKDLDKLPKNTSLFVKKSYLSFLTPINKEKYNYTYKTYDLTDEWFINKDASIYKFISKNTFDSYLFKDNTSFSSKTIIDNLSNIDKTTGFSSATLISSDDSVFVIVGDKKHPIHDEATFKLFGYNFDNVIKSTSEERALYTKGKLFTTSSAHPSGTIFYAEDTDRTFIFDNSLLNKIQTTDISSQHSIVVQEQSRTTSDSCVLQKTLLPRQYSCTIQLDNTSDFNGNIYQFTLNDSPNTKIELAEIKLHTKVSEQSLVDRIVSLKKKIGLHYN
ncbi:MAG: hypothetical protein ACKUBY_04795 [Candidatus Moraniibacteriota bacterium]|jgi:hypothetical protein